MVSLQRTIAFIKELSRIIPNSEPFWRRKSSIKKTIKQAIDRGFTDIVVVNEDNRHPNGLVISHLPDGPTAHFRLSNVKVAKELNVSHGFMFSKQTIKFINQIGSNVTLILNCFLQKDFRQITSHRPEVILNNFSTRLGHTVARMLASLFHYDPEFKGRRAVTFHNQRDYIFFRHHM